MKIHSQILPSAFAPSQRVPLAQGTSLLSDLALLCALMGPEAFFKAGVVMSSLVISGFVDQKLALEQA